MWFKVPNINRMWIIHTKLTEEIANICFVPLFTFYASWLVCLRVLSCEISSRDLKMNGNWLIGNVNVNKIGAVLWSFCLLYDISYLTDSVRVWIHFLVDSIFLGYKKYFFGLYPERSQQNKDNIDFNDKRMWEEEKNHSLCDSIKHRADITVSN